MSTKTSPSLSLERTLFEGGAKYVLGIDEVGRGAIAGPVAVGVAIIEVKQLSEAIPVKLKDSKLLSEKVREGIFEPVANWVSSWAVGMAEASEIDERGIVWCLEAAAKRAIDQLEVDFPNSIAILDGSHNWLARAPFRVVVQPKADRDCASVAAASVLAKVTRDRLMIELDQRIPGYGLSGHKGYASASHMDAVRSLGASQQHRTTWLGRILGA